MCDNPDYTSGMGATSGVKRDPNSEAMRRTLRDAREKGDIPAHVVAERIVRILHEQGDLDASKPSVNTIYMWEKFERHPSISNFQAWALALGYRLHVQLDDARGDAAAILVRSEEAAEAARRIDLLPETKRKSIIDVIRSMTGG